MESPLAQPDYQALFESAPGLYLVLTPDLRIVAASDAYLAATQTRREELLGRHLFEAFPDNPDEPGATGVRNLKASLERVRVHGRPDAMAVQKYDIRRPEGDGFVFEERHWSPVNSPVLDSRGELRWIIHRVEDVTEFVRLKQQRARQSEAAEQVRVRAEHMEAEIYRRAQEIADANRLLHELQADLESRVRSRTADLQAVNLDLRNEATERRRTQDALEKSEAQLRHAQKLEAVGRLAGGIAHDFNNLLTVILSYAEMILAQLAPGAPHRAELEEVLRAGERAADLTRQLLAFSRQQVLEPRVLDVNDVVGGVKAIFLRVLGEDVEMRFVPGKGLGRVRVDPSQLEQVLMNLVVNARDAMPTGGKLTIATSNAALDEAYAREHEGVAPGEYVQLSVSDTGIGMDAATQARIFEPFFTTKPVGKGTGLGLATVFGIVRQSGGHVWVYSEPGAGTTFRVYLPRVEDAVPQAVASRPRPEPGTGSETILLVEDAEPIRSVAVAILQRAGYHVLEAQGPGEALLIAEQHPARIDLLLTDVVMPKMSGRQLAERIAATRSEIRLLFMSGHTDDAILHHGVLDSGFAFVQKPLTPAVLSRRVREVLDAPSRRSL